MKVFFVPDRNWKGISDWSETTLAVVVIVTNMFP
jgi:hypothetical protein